MKNAGEFESKALRKDRAAAIENTNRGSIKTKLVAIFPYMLGLLVLTAFAMAFLIVWLLKI